MRHIYLNNNNTSLNLTTRESDDDDVLSTNTCIIVYSILIATIFFVALIRSISFYNVCIKASQTLHDNMFTALISTTMRFFNVNPPGRILNRFSRDIGQVIFHTFLSNSFAINFFYSNPQQVCG